ncbi:hypothetical protein BGZ51_006528 [Haplosporangium sp. Z 767]|nr:hypothetical protein BGZ50_006571 [Haplosporangium sp. Z 11]KAF9179982.1 hypothetical protein BGZ51_006528 [Haplosporangium sp. Z 767]
MLVDFKNMEFQSSMDFGELSYEALLRHSQHQNVFNWDLMPLEGHTFVGLLSFFKKLHIFTVLYENTK